MYVNGNMYVPELVANHSLCRVLTNEYNIGQVSSIDKETPVRVYLDYPKARNLMRERLYYPKFRDLMKLNHFKLKDLIIIILN